LGAMLNIMLADDHKMVRQSLKALLSTEPDFNVVGEAENGLEALEMTAALKPDILVLDLTMPLLSGLQVTRVLSQQAGSPRIIILSMQSCEAYVIETLRSGAQAYVSKESSPEDLITAIRQVSNGSRFVSSSLSNEFRDGTVGSEDRSETGPTGGSTMPRDISRMASKPQQMRNSRKNGNHRTYVTNPTKPLYA
jgi:DNA-binding NarL/FixJ family response regulator